MKKMSTGRNDCLYSAVTYWTGETGKQLDHCPRTIAHPQPTDMERNQPHSYLSPSHCILQLGLRNYETCPVVGRGIGVDRTFWHSLGTHSCKNKRRKQKREPIILESQQNRVPVGIESLCCGYVVVVVRNSKSLIAINIGL